MEFQIGQRVVLRHGHQDHGVILSFEEDDDMYGIKWDDGTESKEYEEELKIERVFDAEFEKVRLEVNAKLHEAAKLIREAAALASPTGERIGVYHGYGSEESPFDAKVIEKAIGAAGWSTSSWYC